MRVDMRVSRACKDFDGPLNPYTECTEYAAPGQCSDALQQGLAAGCFTQTSPPQPTVMPICLP